MTIVGTTRTELMGRHLALLNGKPKRRLLNSLGGHVSRIQRLRQPQPGSE
jgi:hypothetical protein